VALLEGGEPELGRAATAFAGVDAQLRGAGGVTALLESPSLVAGLEGGLAKASLAVADIERALDMPQPARTAADTEAANAALVRLKDALWALRCDRLPAAAAVGRLAGVGDAARRAAWSVHVALRSLERLEVRGRDSAGLQVFVTGHALSGDDAEVIARSADPLFRSGAVRARHGGLAFVYKAAAEVGELGDNIRVLRDAITADALLWRALAADGAEAAILGHTRWASVGIISEANAHPLDSAADTTYVAASLNGDVDNHLALRAAEGLAVRAEITTDAKVIPLLVAKRMAEGERSAEAFRRTVATFDGSVAIAAHAGEEPGRLHLALRGSGQALYVGLIDAGQPEAFVVASEPYGVVEETSRYLRMDGEGTGGQVVTLDRDDAGALSGLERRAYDGRPLPVASGEIVTAEITTRDIDRAGYPHFLLKEISEAPQSFRKTLRGKLREEGGRLTVGLGDETLSPDLRQKLNGGQVRRITIIGQGTSAVAAQSLASALGALLPAGTTTKALPATELSGFGLDDDMSDTLVVAISQSGTTTDTNRTVDLARARGAAVVAIVNRRNSDLVEKADGVLYTSDGRDVEMSVPSTKAFYAQVAAGFLLAVALAQETRGSSEGVAGLLAGLLDLPAAMEEVLATRSAIAVPAWEWAPRRRYWAVVGNGPNRVAAAELRIKLSELAYKSIACDATEDKKHIDLSAEPMILVCATGLPPAGAADVAKELDIYRAHKAVPIVIATAGTQFPAAVATLTVPPAHPQLAFILSTMAGHLFGYEAALAINATARPLREARAAIEALADPAVAAAATNGNGSGDLRVRLAPQLTGPAQTFAEGIASGFYDGALHAATAVRLSSAFRFATGRLPLDLYEIEHGRVGTPAVAVEDLLEALTAAIEELTRPIDAIKHQAKTVTVGISRSEEALFTAPLVAATLAAGAPRDRLTYRVVRTLGALGPAVVEVTGFTRYGVSGPVVGDEAVISVLGKGGVAAELVSRAETEARPRLRGAKHRAATLREVTVAKGANDGRTVVIVPEIRQGEVVGITLLHARFADTLPADGMRAVLTGYQQRYDALVDAVTERLPDFDVGRLASLPVIDLLTSPVYVLAERWRD
jgi:glucosamine--fructose-6-phosphate aminotransferase (isomerizing)